MVRLVEGGTIFLFGVLQFILFSYALKGIVEVVI